MVRSIPLNLSPGQSFDLTVYSGDGDRFAKQFRETWRQIPADVRAQILGHWSKGTYVLIELSNIWRDHVTRLAVVGDLGYEAKFDADVFAAMPDSVAQFVIAHELAHVYQYAINAVTRTYKDEEQADDLAEAWGFDWIGTLTWKAKRFPQGSDRILSSH